MAQVVCDCGKEMEFYTEFTPVIEEYLDYYKCTCGHITMVWDVEE